MDLSYEKYDKQAVEIGLYNEYTIIFFSASAIFNWSTQIFSRWYLIAKCIKFWLEVDTPIFLYNHSEASVQFVDFAN